MIINCPNLKEFEYTCEDTQELLLLYVMCSEELACHEIDSVHEHLAKCPDCKREFEELRWAKDLFSANREYLLNSGIFDEDELGKPSANLSEIQIVDLRNQARLDRAGRRLNRRKCEERIAIFKRATQPIYAAVACLVIAISVWFVINQANSSNTMAPRIVANHESVKIEVVSDNTAELIPSGELIVTADKLKTLRINGNRLMILNSGTELSIVPHNSGCIVKLVNGEIYTEVEHDGKSFIVETTHGRAIITGTTFNIKASDKQMELGVVEGTVRFEGNNGFIDVTAGKKSLLVLNSMPTLPESCYTRQLTAWTAGVDSLEDVGGTISSYMEIPLWTFDNQSIELENLGFDSWITERKYWFEREFPWTKQLQSLLASDGIEIDTLDLLIGSGDLWRFGWPKYSNHRLLFYDEKILRKTAEYYGTGIEKLISTNSISIYQVEQVSNIEAFGKWLSAFEGGRNDLTFDSIHAATFLINTRSLTWYAVNSGIIQVEGRQQVLDLLQEQVNIASNLVCTLNQMLANEKETYCSEIQYCEYVGSSILAMMEIERELAKYEVVSE